MRATGWLRPSLLSRQISISRCQSVQRALHITHASTRPVPPLAFVFDIDGVLVRGPNVLPAAKKALATLHGDNPFNVKIPYILLTNGGGVAEAERCERLSAKLSVSISEAQYIQAHTILKKHSHQYANEHVLVLGGKLDKVRQVAEIYGFQKVHTTLDILAWNPAVWPFHDLTEAERAVAKPSDFSQIPISAVFVFHDPRNWALDVQILCDIVQSGGIVGGPPVQYKYLSKPVTVVFCNPDLLWRSDFEQPRLGQGAFKEAFQAVYKALTGEHYPHVQYGKPTKETYDFAQEAIQRLIHEEFCVTNPTDLTRPSLYMIGDNPESDIAGANAAKWNSVLVKTGVYDPKHGPPNHPPTHIAEDVNEAVKWAIEREFARHGSQSQGA